MRVFHIGIPNDALSKALSKLGPYEYLDWTDWVALPNNEKNLRLHTIKRSSEFRPDITFLQLQSAVPYDAETLKQIGGFKINWTWDVRSPFPEWFINVASSIDITCFTNEYDVKHMNSLGLNSMFLQSGFDSDVFTPSGITNPESPEIVFMGNNYDYATYKFPMSSFREEMTDFLSNKYGNRFRVFGFGWKFKTESLVYREVQEALTYRSCKIAISVSHYELDRYTSDRIFRIMGSGAFCLCKWYPGVEKDFVDGVHLRTWKTLEELQSLIEYYLNNSEERTNIAKRGCDLVRSNYTWDKTVENIKNTVNENRQRVQEFLC